MEACSLLAQTGIFSVGLDWICARGCGELVRSIGVTFLSGIDFPEATFQDLSCSLQTSAELGLTVNNMQNARQKGSCV